MTIAASCMPRLLDLKSQASVHDTFPCIKLKVKGSPYNRPQGPRRGVDV